MSETSRARMRSVSVAAKTVYRELCKSGHDQGEVMAFVNELLDQVLHDGDGPQSEAAQVVDPETGALSADVLHSVVERECALARESGAGPISVASLQLHLPKHWPHDACVQAHRALIACVTDRLRAGDVLGRVDAHGYAIALRTTDAATTDLRDGLRRAARSALPKTGTSPEAPRLAWRQATFTKDDANGAALLERCMQRPPYELLERSSEVPDAPAPEGDRRGVVLALEGIGARAALHVGALYELRARGVDVVGIAASGTASIIAAMFACGVERAEMLDKITAFPTTRLYRDMRRAYAASLQQRPAAEDARSLEDTFIRQFVPHDADLERLRPRLSICAADLATGRLVSFCYGSLHTALRGACATPGLFPPFVAKGAVLVDSSVFGSPTVRLAAELAPDAPVVAIVADPSVRAVSATSSTVASRRRSAQVVYAELVREQLRAADVVVPIEMSDVGLLSFQAARELADRGRDAVARIADRLGAQGRR